MPESPYQAPSAHVSEDAGEKRLIPQATLLVTLCVISLCFVALMLPSLVSLMLSGDVTVLFVLPHLIAAVAVLAGSILATRGQDRGGKIAFAIATVSALWASFTYFTVAMALCVIVGVFGFFACRNSRPAPIARRIEPT